MALITAGGRKAVPFWMARPRPDRPAATWRPWRNAAGNQIKSRLIRRKTVYKFAAGVTNHGTDLALSLKQGAEGEKRPSVQRLSMELCQHGFRTI